MLLRQNRDMSMRRKAILGLAAAGVVDAIYRRELRDRHLTWGSTPAEAARAMPGDDLLPDADVVATRAIGIDAPPSAV